MDKVLSSKGWVLLSKGPLASLYTHPDKPKTHKIRVNETGWEYRVYYRVSKSRLVKKGSDAKSLKEYLGN